MDLFELEKLNRHKNDGQGFIKMARRIRINALMSEYYEQLGEEYADLLKTRGGKTEEFRLLMHRRSIRILGCGRFVHTRRFKDLGVHEIKQIKLCGDKFCGNCQKQLANARERKFTPLLNELAKNFDLYHITFTVPNVPGEKLPKTVKDITERFGQMMKYILCRKKIRGITFENFGCVGAIRSLEITHNGSRADYHPHLHCIFVFRKGLQLDKPKVFTNRFSYEKGRKTSQFSAFEIFIQKLWFLCINGERVTKKAIDSLECGYSCKVNYADGNYHQIFKYAIKGLLDEKKAEMRRSQGVIDRNISFEEFCCLFFALEGRRTMQGYGCFNKLKFDDVKEENEEEFNSIIRELSKISKDDDYANEKLMGVIENIVVEKEIYISKKSIRQDLDSLKSDD
ncbi:MAG: protein rep [Candidatus Coproplasma sp.]